MSISSSKPELSSAEIAKAVATPRKRREVLILSPYFPPSTLAGVHRARHLAKHLPTHGWLPTVMCVDESYYEEQLDPDLAALVPTTVEIAKVGAVPTWLSRRMGVGDVGLRAWIHLRRSLFDLMIQRPISAVLITGSPFYPMLLAPEIKRRMGVPVILDFQDPWVPTRHVPAPLISKHTLAQSFATVLEPRALRGADFVTSVSDIQNAEMARRYPWLDASRMAAIPIGGDLDDFAAVRPSSVTLDKSELEPGFIHLSYVGTFMPRSAPLVHTLLRAFARLRSCQPALAARIRLNFIGTSNQPNDGKTYPVRAVAEAEGVADAVKEIPRRLPYLQALKVMVNSNALLLIGSDEPHYTASKIYPALMSGRPYLSLFHRASSAHSILSSAGGGRTFAFEISQDLSALEEPIAEALKTLILNPSSFGVADGTSYAPYEAGNIARRFADIFDRVSNHAARTS